MKLVSMAAAAALSLAAGASLAQAGPPAGAPGPHAHAQRGPHMDPAQMAERHAQHLRDALQLRPDQEPALKALMASMVPPPGAMEQMRAQHDAMRNLTTPQRLDRMQAMMGEHEARFRQHAEAIKRFYAQLTPAQQKAFDAMPMMGHEHGPGRGHEHGVHGGPGMMRHGPGGPGGPGAPPPPAGL